MDTLDIYKKYAMRTTNNQIDWQVLINVTNLVKLICSDSNDRKEKIESIFRSFSSNHETYLKNIHKVRIRNILLKQQGLIYYGSIAQELSQNYDDEYANFENILNVYCYDKSNPIEVSLVLKKLEGNLIIKMLYMKYGYIDTYIYFKRIWEDNSNIELKKR